MTINAIPESHRNLLEGPVYVTLTTLMPDGQPQSSVIWWDYEGEYITINSAKGRQKDKNMRADPRVTLLAIDPENPLRWLEVRGRVEIITEEGGVEHIDRLAKKYAGVDQYYGEYAPAERRHTETRVTYKIRPTRVNIFPTSG